jgi:5'-3' exoribonuclease 2
LDIIIKVDKERIIDDYIFICFLLGNDFINHSLSLNIRYNGYEILLSVYKYLQDKYQGYYNIVDRRIPNIISLYFLKEFIHELSKREKSSIQNIISIRNKQYRKIYGEYSHEFNILMRNRKNNNQYFTLDELYKYQFKNNNDDRIKDMITNLPLLLKTDNYMKEYNSLCCEDYLDSLVWTCHYYFKKCINWRWETKYNEGVNFVNFNKYLDSINYITIKENNKEFTNKEQLEYILSSDNNKLHEYNFKKREYKLLINMNNNRYLWECKLDFI